MTAHTWQTELGPAIRHVRERRRMTQQDLATAAGCTAAYVYRLEAGRQRPHIDFLEPLAQALRVSVWRLLKLAADRAAMQAKKRRRN